MEGRFSILWFTIQMAPRTGLNQSKNRSQELLCESHVWVPRPKDFGQTLLLFQGISKKLDQKWNTQSTHMSLTRDASVARG